MLRWETSGLVYEPDQRHAEVIIRELGLENAGSVLTPGTRAEHDVASAPNGVLGIPLEEESEPMNPQDATRFRGLAARCNYLGQDRVDLQYACKEVSRRMAKPRCQSSSGRADRSKSTSIRIQTGRDARPHAEAPAEVLCCGVNTA